MATRSTQFFLGTVPSNLQTVLYTVPDNVIALLKSYIVDCSTVAAAAFSTLWIQAPAGQFATFFRATLEPSTFVKEEIWHVMLPGDTIRMITDKDQVYTLLSGALLPL